MENLLDPYGDLGRFWRPLPLPGPYPIFQAKYVDIIREIIKSQQLKPSALQTPVEMHMALAQLNQPEAAKIASAKVSVVNIRGGMRIPHLHLDGDIFLLNDEQWKEFCGKVINQLQTKLSTAKAVSYQQLAEVSEAVGALA